MNTEKVLSMKAEWKHGDTSTKKWQALEFVRKPQHHGQKPFCEFTFFTPDCSLQHLEVSSRDSLDLALARTHNKLTFG
jgi:hypothetical protein